MAWNLDAFSSAVTASLLGLFLLLLSGPWWIQRK